MADRDLEQLHRDHSTYVFRALCQLGARPEDIERLVGNVFVRAWRERAHLAPTLPVRAWLFGLAYRVLAQHHRSAPILRRAAARHPIEPLAPRSDPRWTADAWKLLLQALSALDLDQRAIVVLHDLEATSASVIAAALKIPEKAVYARLRLARERMIGTVRTR